MDDLICPLCNKQYDLEIKIPRLFPNCGHTFCSECIITIIEKDKYDIYCPEDGIKCDFYKERLGVNSFPLNFALQKLIKKNKKKPKKEKPEPKPEPRMNYDIRNKKVSDFSGVNYCMEHQKIAELICQKEKVIICTDCVLFGEHKSHVYLKITEFKKESKNKILELEKKCNKLKKHKEYELVKSYENHKNFLSDKVTETKDFLLANIREKFSFLIEELRNKERDMTDNLESEFLRFDDTIKFLASNSQKISKKQIKFEKNIKNLKIQIKQPNPNFNLLLEKLHSDQNLNVLHKSILEEYDIHTQNIDKLINKELEKYEIKGDTQKIHNFFQEEIKIITGKEIENDPVEKKSIESEKDDRTRLVSVDKENSKIQISDKSGGFIISEKSNDDKMSSIDSNKSGISGISEINQNISSDDGSNDISLIDGDLSDDLDDETDFMNLSNNIMDKKKIRKKKNSLFKNESQKKITKNTSFLKKKKQDMMKIKTNKNNILGNLYKRSDNNNNSGNNFIGGRNNNFGSPGHNFADTFGNNNYQSGGKKNNLYNNMNKSLYKQTSINDLNQRTDKFLYQSQTVDVKNGVNWKDKNFNFRNRTTNNQQTNFQNNSNKVRSPYSQRNLPSTSNKLNKKFEKKFSKQNITDSNLITILKEVNNSKIKILDLSNNRITEIGFDMIMKKLYNHNNLKEIRLNGNYLDDKIFRTLNRYVNKLKSLKTFYFLDNKFKSKAKIKNMAKNFSKYGINIIF